MSTSKAKPKLACQTPSLTKALKRKAKVLATTFIRQYVTDDQEDSAVSDSDDESAQNEHAMFARVQMASLPKLTVQSIYGQNSLIDLVESNSM